MKELRAHSISISDYLVGFAMKKHVQQNCLPHLLCGCQMLRCPALTALLEQSGVGRRCALARLRKLRGVPFEQWQSLLSTYCLTRRSLNPSWLNCCGRVDCFNPSRTTLCICQRGLRSRYVLLPPTSCQQGSGDQVVASSLLMLGMLPGIMLGMMPLNGRNAECCSPEMTVSARRLCGKSKKVVIVAVKVAVLDIGSCRSRAPGTTVS